MFPLSFPFGALSSSRSGEWIFDPFCGRGTTILAARLRGLPSVGVDSNPVAGAIAASKMARVRPSEISALARGILEDPPPGPVPGTPHGEFWSLCYAPKTLRDICRIRNSLLNQCTSRLEVALRALILGILHGPTNKGKPTYLSNRMPRTYSTKPAPAIRYWRKHRLKPVEIDVLDAIQRRARFSFAAMPPSTPGMIVTGDSRIVSFERLAPRYTWVITSPPYYGMRSYVPDQWLRNWFLGGPSNVEYYGDEQLSHQSEDQFIADLATVWKRTADVCVPGAKFVCRFGALASRTKEPRTLLKQSLSKADCGWRITTIGSAGTSQHGRRQCDQFGSGKNEPIEEVDVYAILEA
jgi:hypothetical protein